MNRDSSGVEISFLDVFLRLMVFVPTTILSDKFGSRRVKRLFLGLYPNEDQDFGGLINL